MTLSTEVVSPLERDTFAQVKTGYGFVPAKSDFADGRFWPGQNMIGDIHALVIVVNNSLMRRALLKKTVIFSTHAVMLRGNTQARPGITGF